MAQKLKLLIEAENPIISIESVDETRAVHLIREIADSMSRSLLEWSVTQGLVPTIPNPEPAVVSPGKSATAALEYVKSSPTPAVYLFKDLGAHCKDATVQRHLRDLYYSADSRLWTMIMLDAVPPPPEIRRLAVPFELGWPDEAELEKIVRDTFQRAKQRSLMDIDAKITKREMEQLVQTLRGLTCEEASRIVSAAIYDDYVLDGEDVALVVEAKRRRLERIGCLDSIVPDVTPDQIGGLDNLKAWLDRRKQAFTARAKEYGLESPRGILLLGVQGCGKSLCAKVVASSWRMPLLHLDPGNLYNKFIGESESRLREALQQAETMAPVILWIDEIEKAFASSGGDSSDGGLSQRMFGTLLTWMQDHRHPIFLVATANNIASLPPELLRKGRFDEVFFVDLPSRKSRMSIFSVHLKRRKRDPAKFDLESLADHSAEFSGAEIEQAIVSAMYSAFYQNAEIATEHVIEELSQTRPLATLMKERVAELRAWAADRCVRAD